MSTTPVPHWDLSNVYPSLESKEFEAAITLVKSQLADLEAFFVKNLSSSDAQTPVDQLASSQKRLDFPGQLFGAT